MLDDFNSDLTNFGRKYLASMIGAQLRTDDAARFLISA